MPNLSPTGLLFSTVTAFVLQPQRTKRRVKRDDLDTLSEVYTGPAGGEDNFIPPIGTRHGQYSLMTLIDSSTKQMPGLVVEVTLDYHGKFANAGATGYTSVPTVSKSWMEGEVTYQINGAAAYANFTGPGAGPLTPSSYNVPGILSYSRRYTGRCVTLAYITNRVPTGHPTGVGLSKGFLGFQNIWDTMTGFTAGMKLSGASFPIEQMACTDVRVEDSADGWFKVIETYQSKMFPGVTGYQYPIPAPPTFTGWGNVVSMTGIQTQQGQNQDTQQNQKGTSDQTQVAVQTPKGAAATGGYTLVGSTDGSSTTVDPSIGATTESLIGMDPNLSGYPPISNDPTAVIQGTEPFTGQSSSLFPGASQGDYTPYYTD